MGISQPSYAAWERREVALTASQLGTLAKTFRCEVADFFHHESPKRGRGPTGRASKTFEELSKLLRSKQKDIVDLVENLITAYRIRQAKKEEAQAS
jgi:transcriptional regulator with XRE-family HTH domain